METKAKSLGRLAVAGLAVYALSSYASAAFLTTIINFACRLVTSFRMMGNSLAIVMFVYGAARYVYTADDPGGRKQAISICVACIMALLIIQMATVIIGAVGASTGQPEPCT
jgi:hypothetical protein